MELATKLAGCGMKERPFIDPMVAAILAGRKTQTRRVMKPQPHPDFLARGVVAVTPQWPLQDGVRWFMADGLSELIRCPYGVPGDRPWVRETWNYTHDLTEAESAKRTEIFRRFNAGEITDIVAGALSLPTGSGKRRAMYAADFGDWAYNVDSDLHWRPSIHMPRWASRITLEITGVRVDRLQEISEEDAGAEGVEPVIHGGILVDEECFKRGFQKTWAEINGKRPGCAWADNPWVWCLSFKVVDSGEESHGQPEGEPKAMTFPASSGGGK